MAKYVCHTIGVIKIRFCFLVFCILQTPSEEVLGSRPPAEDKPSEQRKPAAKTPETIPSSPVPESIASKKKPAGAVSLFGGIDVLASKQTKSPLDEANSDDNFLPKDSPPPLVKKEEKVKKNTVSLFDEDEEDESDWNEPIFMPSKSTTGNTLKVRMICSKPKNSVKKSFSWCFVSSAVKVQFSAIVFFFSTACRGSTTSKEHRCLSG